MIELFEEKEDCCGCAGCANVCPKNAIKMQQDEDGFLYPIIDNTICIKCGLCKKVCAYQDKSVTGNKALATYVSIEKDKTTLKNSSSGGAFMSLAKVVLDHSGVVFGCAYDKDLKPIHIDVKTIEELKRLQGSKYVQSEVGYSYAKVKNYLMQDKKVLFTGTPCQVASLKSFLGKKYDNLLTVDLICHGVPSSAFFSGYIKFLEQGLKGKILDFKFRDKTNGWGLQACCTYQVRDGSILYKKIRHYNSSYYSYFLNGETYRINCYSCKYACELRQGDFTLGDYWGIANAHPEILEKEGVSVLLANTNEAVALIGKIANYSELTISEFEKAKAENHQLRHPTKIGPNREKILEVWKYGGYQEVENMFLKENKINRIRGLVIGILPKSLKDALRKKFR